MNCILTFITLCVVGINAIAIPKPGIQGRVGGGIVAENAPHACMVLVHRQGLAPTDVVLGGGSIVSRRRVLTAAHLVQGTNTKYQVGYFVATSRRMADSTFVVIHSDFDSTTYNSDIALIFFTTDIFPVANIINISPNAAQPTPGTNVTLAGFGFTYHHSYTATQIPYASTQNIANNACNINGFAAAATHVCGVDESFRLTFVCPGDNGAGLYVIEENVNVLVGVASRIDTFCGPRSQTAYTRVSTFAIWINNLL